jgi:beta-lactamase class A
MATTTLGARIDHLVASLPGVTGVVVWRPDAEAPLLARHAERTFALASVVKLPLLLETLRRAERGALDLGERVRLDEAARVAGSGVLHLLDTGLAPTLRDLLRLAMVVSDNTATDALFARVPPHEVEAAMHALGYASLRVPHTIEAMLRSCAGLGDHADYAAMRARFADAASARPTDPDGASPTRGDRATPLDVARMLVDLQAGRVLGEPWRTLALTILGDCQTNGRIPARLPEGTRVAHKTGTLRGRTNDVGIVETPSGPVVLALFQEGEPSERLASAALAEVALAVYEVMSAPPASSPGAGASPG